MRKFFQDMSEGKTLLLIDGHALAFREYYALERTGMRTSDGTPTWAVFGFFKAIFDLLQKDKLALDAIAVTFDVSHHTFRTESYEEYKANREKMPDDMSCQMGLIYEGLEAFNIPVYMKEGFEADDVIGTISKKATELGHKTLILTGDQDSFQLVDKDGFVKVIIPSKGELIEYNWDKVFEKLGVYPNQVIDYKALRGDTSDNIPGIKGIGEKTAQSLLAEYKTLDNIYENTENLKTGSLKDKIVNGKDMAYKSQYLATIVRDVDVDFDFQHACIELPDMNNVKEYLTKYQLLSFLKNIDKLIKAFNRSDNICGSQENIIVPEGQLGLFATESTTQNSEWANDTVSAEILDNDDKINSFCESAKNGIFFKTVTGPTNDILNYSVDYIVFGLKEFSAEGNTIKFKDNDKIFAHLFILPLKNSYLPETIKNIFKNSQISKFTLDSKKEYNTFSVNNWQLNNVIFDAVLADYVENSSSNHELDVQALQLLKISPIDEPKYTLNTEYKQELRNMWIMIRLAKFRFENMSDTNLEILKNIELPLAKVLSYMEITGVSVDTEHLNEMENYLNEKIAVCEEKIYSLAGEKFNINSPQQIGQILFEKLNLPHKKKKKGSANYSTDVNVMEELAQDYEIAKFILEYRKYAKLRSTYTTALLKLVNPKDKRIHTTYNQTVTVTGRLSSSNPNLQNIPARSEEGEKIRAAFVPADRNNKIVSADYSQIELRILAHITQDKNLTEAFKNDIDVHTLTASKVYEVAPENVTKQMRSRAKTVNFGIVYGQSGYGLAKALGITNEEAFAFIDKYFMTYPDVKKYMNEITRKVMLDGFTETIWGRRRYFKDEINSSNAMVREFAKRAAINFPMQGSAADLMKLAMIKFYNNLTENNLKSKLIIQVHDEMVVETYNDEIQTVEKLLKQSMEFENILTVPLKVDISSGATWKFA